MNILWAAPWRVIRVWIKQAAAETADTRGISHKQLVSELQCVMPWVMLTLPSCSQCPASVLWDLLGTTMAHWQSLRPGQSVSAGQNSLIIFSSTQTVAWGTTTSAGTQTGEQRPGASTGLCQEPLAGPTVTVTKVRAVLPQGSSQKCVLHRLASGRWNTLWKKYSTKADPNCWNN